MIESSQEKIQRKIKLENKKALLIKLLDRYKKLDTEVDYLLNNLKEGNIR
jgi:hypothetical protein